LVNGLYLANVADLNVPFPRGVPGVAPEHA
jgi:hypothetical protein